MITHLTEKRTPIKDLRYSIDKNIMNIKSEILCIIQKYSVTFV